MYIRRLLRSLTPFERGLWITSLLVTTGAVTLFDVPPAYLSPKSGAELRKALL